MNHQALEKEILRSWKNCARAGLSPDQPTPSHPLKDRQLERLRTEHDRAITALEASISEVRRELPDHMAFLMTDAQGILVKKNSAGRAVSQSGRGRLLCGAVRGNQRDRALASAAQAGSDGAPAPLLRVSQRMVSLRAPAPSIHADALPRHCDGAGIHHPAPPHAARPPLPDGVPPVPGEPAQPHAGTSSRPPERTAAGGPPVPRAGDDREGGRGAAASVRGHSQVPQAEPLPNLQRALQRQPGGEGAPERRFFFGGDRCLRGRAAGLPFWAAGGKSRLPTRLGVWRGRGSGAILASRFKPPAFPPDRRRPLAPLRRERTGAPSLETPFC